MALDTVETPQVSPPEPEPPPEPPPTIPATRDDAQITPCVGVRANLSCSTKRRPTSRFSSKRAVPSPWRGRRRTYTGRQLGGGVFMTTGIQPQTTPCVGVRANLSCSTKRRPTSRFSSKRAVPSPWRGRRRTYTGRQLGGGVFMLISRCQSRLWRKLAPMA